MQCPVDGETLVMADRSGVEIDYCPRCRGVWLDRGELDKIIDRAAGAAPAAVPVREAPARTAETAPVYQREPAAHQARGDRRRDDDDDHDDDRRYRKKRRDSFLSDIFDF
jgi:hypothetical protein